MSVEDELELVPPETPGWKELKAIFFGRTRYYRGVSTLYLDDLQRIYRAIDSALDEEKEVQQQEIARMQRFEDEIVQSHRRMGTAYTSKPVPEIFTRPLISMKSEEYVFLTLKQVEAVKRRGFKKFELTSPFPGIGVYISSVGVTVRPFSEDRRFVQASARIGQVVRERQNPIFGFLFHPVTVIVYIIAAVLIWISAVIAAVVAESVALVWVASASIYVLWIVWGVHWFVYSRRRISVVPRYEIDVYRTPWERHEGSIVLILGIVGCLIALVAWWFPKT